MELRCNQSDICTILVVDDDPAMRSLLVDELSENGCQVIESTDGQDALGQAKRCMPDVIITDLNMPQGGFGYLQNLRSSFQNCAIIVITAFGNSQTKKKSNECGATAYFDKPVRVKDLKASLQQICPISKSQMCQNHVTRDYP